ncbi:MAG: G1 family endopeptidase [Candidatus Dependentiae bacterium]|nr:G1 family endopeptidase [Candidatus Dependentiae bacterium]
MQKSLIRYSLCLLVICINVFGNDDLIKRGFTHVTSEFHLIDGTTNRKNRFPHIPHAQGTSQNWSGYVAATNLTHPLQHSVTKVSGSWTVPTVSSAAHDTHCAIWVGIDGYSSESVEQIGTSHDFINGHQDNYAWFEMYPNYAYEITGFPVNVGDSISASVVYIGNNTFTLTLINNTRRVYVVIPSSYTKSSTAQRSSAEWIVEAPYENGILPLSHFSMIKFLNCTTTINGTTAAIKYRSWADDFLTMVTNTNTPKATVSALSTNGQNFNVTWNHE